jgi:hypothetical protein
VVVPVASVDAAFVFNEGTGDYQAATIQGQLTYRITEPRRSMEMLMWIPGTPLPIEKRINEQWNIYDAQNVLAGYVLG